MTTSLSRAYPPGCIVTTSTGRYLVEPLEREVPPGYLLARRAERPMTRARAIRVHDILESAAGATSGPAVP